jgi:hypothetical protein
MGWAGQTAEQGLMKVRQDGRKEVVGCERSWEEARLLDDESRRSTKGQG